MDIYEYLPQLIVAYDGNDEFANLIHVKKADVDKNYYCPCCGGTVKPRAINSSKEQSHYYHKTSKCTKESQLHFFCKNWLFEAGSRFYINDELFEVTNIDVEKKYETPFGNYRPDITVHTSSGKIIYFEMFFSNRKTGDDYFCKWDALGHDVVEVDLKEYMFKTDENIIPTFRYLYHDGVCYSKTYEKRDLYATTIAKIKRELTRQKILNYKTRIEQLDWFWQKMQNNDTKESILAALEQMSYEDMISCYSIIKRKHCVSHLKADALRIINKKVISDVRNSLPLPHDENVYFDLKHIRGRTYEAGIRLNIKTEHIIYNDFYIKHDKYEFDRLNGYPKIVFHKGIHTLEELSVPATAIKNLQTAFNNTFEYKKELLEFEEKLLNFEGDNYRIRVRNNLYTVLLKTSEDNYGVLLENFNIPDHNLDLLSKAIQNKKQEVKDKEYIENILHDENYNSILFELETYKDMGFRVDIKYDGNVYAETSGVYFKLYFYDTLVYNALLHPSLDDFIHKTNRCKKIISNFIESNAFIVDAIEKINNCKNNFWKAQISSSQYKYLVIKIDQKYFTPKHHYTFEKIYLNALDKQNKQSIISLIEDGMKKVLKNMEYCGYRIMEDQIYEK